MTKKYKGIIIKGSGKFFEKTSCALNFIERKSKRNFNKIKIYLNSIRQARQSGMNLSRAEFHVSNSAASHSTEWYASIIIHDVHHYYLHHIKKLKWEPKNFLKHEHLCLDEQLRFLKKIKSYPYIIQHLKKSYKRGYWRPSYQKSHKSW